MKVKVYAKLNLSLNIDGVCDGYHLLDAVTTSIDIFDVVEVSLRDDGQINVYGVDIPQQQNVAYKVAKRFFDTFSGSGCDVTIQKNIPFSQGLGGSSADASATVYCLAKLLDVALDNPLIKQVCDSVGSDVYFMLHGGFGKIVARSQMVQLPKINLCGCLTCFDYKSETAMVFKQYDLMPSNQRTNNDHLVATLLNGDIDSANKLCFNALQQPSNALFDYASKYSNCCQTLGVKATMTGSGSAYFILCKSLQQAQELSGFFNNNGFVSQVFNSVPFGIEEI